MPTIHSNIMNTNLTKMTSALFSQGLFFLPEIRILELFLALLVFVVIHSLRQQKHQGLPVWPIVGMLPSLVVGLRVNMYEWISDVLCRQNGTFLFKGPWFTNLKCVVTSDPRNVEHILKTKFSVYPKGDYFRHALRDLLGNGIFNADNESWQRQRKTASIEFHSAKFRQLTTESLLELVHHRLLPVLEDSVQQSIPVDLQDILLRLTFDNVCMIAFGVDPGCLRSGLPEIPFAQAFEAATEASIIRFVTPTLIWRSMRYLNLGTEKKLKQSIKGVDVFAEEVIRTRKKELSLQFAGRDTSSVALSWFFWLVDQNPAVEERILSEVCRIIGEREDANKRECKKSPLIFRPEEVKKMEYLNQAFPSHSL